MSDLSDTKTFAVHLAIDIVMIKCQINESNKIRCGCHFTPQCKRVTPLFFGQLKLIFCETRWICRMCVAKHVDWNVLLCLCAKPSSAVQFVFLLSSDVAPPPLLTHSFLCFLTAKIWRPPLVMTRQET